MNVQVIHSGLIIKACLRKIFTGAQKAKVALEAVRNTKTINEIAQEYGVHPTRIGQWKKELMENAGSLFEGKRGPKTVNVQNDPDRLYAKIRQLNMELDWLKKVWDQPLDERQTWITADDVMALSTQCKLLKVTRSVVNEQKKRLLKAIDENECLLLRLLDEGLHAAHLLWLTTHDEVSLWLWTCD